MKRASEYCVDPIVAKRYHRRPAFLDLRLQAHQVCLAARATFVKCISWYDNEMGYLLRVALILPKFLVGVKFHNRLR